MAFEGNDMRRTMSFGSPVDGDSGSGVTKPLGSATEEKKGAPHELDLETISVQHPELKIIEEKNLFYIRGVDAFPAYFSSIFKAGRFSGEIKYLTVETTSTSDAEARKRYDVSEKGPAVAAGANPELKKMKTMLKSLDFETEKDEKGIQARGKVKFTYNTDQTTINNPSTQINLSRVEVDFFVPREKNYTYDKPESEKLILDKIPELTKNILASLELRF